MITLFIYSINNFLYIMTKDFVRQILTCMWITDLSSYEDNSKLCPSFACIGRIRMVNLITASVLLVIKRIYAWKLKVRVCQTMAERSQIAGVPKEQFWLLLYGSYIKEPSGPELFPVGLKSFIFFFSSVQEIMVIANPEALKLFRIEAVNIYSRKQAFSLVYSSKGLK